MNQDLLEIISKYQTPDDSLSQKDKEKISRYIPVPTDYEILWADIATFGGHPSGVVITDRALIIKAHQRDVKALNKEIKKKNKSVEKEDRQSKVPYLYQIIPWDYYYPEEYDVEIIDSLQNQFVYSLNANNEEIIRFHSKPLYEILLQYKNLCIRRSNKLRDVSETIVFSAQNTIGAESTMFAATYGASNTKTGHGIYAEEAGSALDRLHGERSTVIGRDNARNGADKIVGVGGQSVQCKYYSTAAESVDACFQRGSNGSLQFRYFDLDGNPMKIEVPKDQYADAIRKMESHIEKGEVAGVSDPQQASEIIREGRITYQQAVNLAKAGTIESLSYDTAKAAVNCLSVLGVSAVVTFALIYWNERDLKKAAKGAIVCSAQIYGLSVAASVLSAQLSKTGLMGWLENAFSKLIQKLPSKFTNSLANSYRIFAGKTVATGAEAQASFAKFLSANTITIAAIALVFSLPDTYRVIRGYISTAQYVKNISTLFASLAGSVAASAGTGAAIGSSAGPLGTAAGFGAGMVGGFVAGGVARLIGNLIIEDDSVLFGRMFNAILMNKAMEYMLSEEEIKRLIELLNEDKKGLKKLQKSFIKSKSQANDISTYLDPLIREAVKGRKKLLKRVEIKLEKRIGNQIFREGAYEV